MAPVMKRSLKAAAAAAKRAKKEAKEAAATAEELAPGEEAEAQKEEVSEDPQDALARQEEATAAARRKELKAMAAESLGGLLAQRGLARGKKLDMVEALVAQEAAGRAEERQRAARLREVVVQKKAELEAMPMAELRDLCSAEAGVKGQLTKQSRVEMLMKAWQEADGVDKALAKRSRDEREEQLNALDKEALRACCERSGVNPYVREVLAERAVRAERAAGRFARPAPASSGPAARASAAPAAAGNDVVEALLASEASRKREAERKKVEEAAAASKRKELSVMSVDQLKELLSSRGVEIAGKKDELVEFAFKVRLQDEAVAARRDELRAMATDDLRDVARNCKVVAALTGKRDALVDAVLAYEAKTREDTRAFDAKAEEVLAQWAAELEEKSGAELKDMCAGKGLRLGVSKEDRVRAIVQSWRAGKDVDAAVAESRRAARAAELALAPLDDLLAVCKGLGVDTVVKEVMVGRLLAHEEEHGRSEAEAPAAAPVVRKRPAAAV